MKIALTEPTSARYIHFNPATNRMHLLVSFIEGQDISTANTRKVDERLKAFFEGDAVNELESYKSMLEFHISLLGEDDTVLKWSNIPGHFYRLKYELIGVNKNKTNKEAILQFRI